jgi:hypothetical protein
MKEGVYHGKCFSVFRRLRHLHSLCLHHVAEFGLTRVFLYFDRNVPDSFDIPPNGGYNGINKQIAESSFFEERENQSWGESDLFGRVPFNPNPTANLVSA